MKRGTVESLNELTVAVVHLGVISAKFAFLIYVHLRCRRRKRSRMLMLRRDVRDQKPNMNSPVKGWRAWLCCQFVQDEPSHHRPEWGLESGGFSVLTRDSTIHARYPEVYTDMAQSPQHL